MVYYCYELLKRNSVLADLSLEKLIINSGCVLLQILHIKKSLKYRQHIRMEV